MHSCQTHKEVRQVRARRSIKMGVSGIALGLMLSYAPQAHAQSIVSAAGIDGNGDGIALPATGTRFGSLAGTIDGVAPTTTNTSATAPQYATDFGGAGQPSAGDFVRYTLDGVYDITTFRLWNDANLVNGQLDGILDFTLIFYDAGGNVVHT